jgi:hypothetical protein
MTWGWKSIQTHLNHIINSLSSLPPIIRKGTAWHTWRAVFGFIALRSKGKLDQLGIDMGSIYNQSFYFGSSPRYT